MEAVEFIRPLQDQGIESEGCGDGDIAFEIPFSGGAPSGLTATSGREQDNEQQPKA
jgi:hypothetical protein